MRIARAILLLYAKTTSLYFGFINAIIRADPRMFFSCSTRQILGPSIRIPHPIGIVIGGNQQSTRIEAGVTILQNVTIGMRDPRARYNGGPPLIIIEEGATLCAGAVILGPIRVGKNAIVAANAVVLTDIPSNSVVGGIPARLLARKDRHIE